MVAPDFALLYWHTLGKTQSRAVREARDERFCMVSEWRVPLVAGYLCSLIRAMALRNSAFCGETYMSALQRAHKVAGLGWQFAEHVGESRCAIW